MMVGLRTKDLADAVQISVQQVRNFEAKGLIPEVERGSNGYRRYTEQHLTALKTAVQLIGGYGLERTQGIMQAVHQGRRGDALALIDARHAELALLRLQLEQTLRALELLAAQLPLKSSSRYSKGVHVGEAARLVGVRVSAIRFWEQQGLLHPVREKESRYRLYDEEQLRRLRIVVLLRQANYDFDLIRTTLSELERGHPQRVVAAVEARRKEVTDMSWRCLGGMATLHAYLCEFSHESGG